MQESMKAQDVKRRNRPLLIAIAVLGLLLYTAGVCASAIYADRRASARQAQDELPWEDDGYALALPATDGGGRLEPGQKITAAGECEFTVTGCAFSRQALAPNAGPDSGGYAASGETQGYVDLSVKYKNLNGAPADIDGVASPLLVCANGDAYSAFAVLESPDASRFIEYAEVAPGGGGRLHYLFLVPTGVGEGAFRIVFTIAGLDYAIGFADGFEE